MRLELIIVERNLNKALSGSVPEIIEIIQNLFKIINHDEVIIDIEESKKDFRDNFLDLENSVKFFKETNRRSVLFEGLNSSFNMLSKAVGLPIRDLKVGYENLLTNTEKSSSGSPKGTINVTTEGRNDNLAYLISRKAALSHSEAKSYLNPAVFLKNRFKKGFYYVYEFSLFADESNVL